MQLRQRIIGAVVVAALAIILIPLLFKSSAPSPTNNQPATIKIAAEIPPEPAKPMSPQTIVMAQDKDLNTASSDLPTSTSAAASTTPANATSINTSAPAAEPAQPANVTMVSTEPVTQPTKKSTKHDAKQASKHTSAKLVKATTNAKTSTTNSHHVTTKVASNSTTTKKAKTVPTATTMSGVAWVVRLGSFANATNAKELETELRAKGFKAYTQNIKSSLGTLVRVAIGPETKREKADAVKERLAKEMQIKSVVVPYNPTSENT